MSQPPSETCTKFSINFYIWLKKLALRLSFLLIVVLSGILGLLLIPQHYIARTSLIFPQKVTSSSIVETPDTAVAIITSLDFAQEILEKTSSETIEKLRSSLFSEIKNTSQSWIAQVSRTSLIEDEATARAKAFLQKLDLHLESKANILSIGIRATDSKTALETIRLVSETYLNRSKAAAIANEAGLHTANLLVANSQLKLQESLDAASRFRNEPAIIQTAKRARAAEDDLALFIAERAALAVELNAIKRLETSFNTNIFLPLLSQEVSLLPYFAQQHLNLHTTPSSGRRIIKKMKSFSAQAAAMDQQDAQSRQSRQEAYAQISDRIRHIDSAIRLRRAIIAAAQDNQYSQANLDQAVEYARAELSLNQEKMQAEARKIDNNASTVHVLSPASAELDHALSLYTSIFIIVALLLLRGIMRIFPQKEAMATINRHARQLFISHEVLKHEKDDIQSPSNLLDKQDNIQETVSASIASSSVFPSSQQPHFATTLINHAEKNAFDALLAHLSFPSSINRGRRLLVIGTDPSNRLQEAATLLAQHLAPQERTILLDLTHSGAQVKGFTDLIAGQASFSEIILRDPTSHLHRVGCGLSSVSALSSTDAMALTLAAFDHTYDWIITSITLEESKSEALAHKLIDRSDGIVIFSSGNSVNNNIIQLYEKLREKGITNVVVAFSGI